MVSTINNDVDQLISELADKKRSLLEKESENTRLKQRIRLLEKALFGPRSERIIDPLGNQPEFEELAAEITALLDNLAEQEKELEQAKPKIVGRKKQKKRRNLQELIPDDLPREEIVIDVPEEDRVCLETGEPLVRIGEERTEKLAYKPGSYFLKVFICPKYASRTDALQGILNQPMPQSAIPGSYFDESFLAGVIVDKCAYHLPLYRQEERFGHGGIDISRQTLSRLYIQSAKVLEPIYLLMKSEILRRGIIFTDDTPVKLQVKGAGKTVTGRMWVYIGGGHGPPYRVFEFTRDRCKNRPAEFLVGYQGYIHADAYSGYDDLFEREGIFECGCWMHVRRKFVDAEDAPKALRAQILRMIRNIYRYERVIRNKSEEIILSIRQTKIKPIIDALFKRTSEALLKYEVLPRSLFAKAIGYMQNLGDALKTFLKDARLKPDNGESERAIRPLAIGRKNWLFVGSKNGGEATGILLSIIQSCRVLNIDPFRYLDDVLRRVNDTDQNDLANLLPHNWKPATSYYTPKSMVPLLQ